MKLKSIFITIATIAEILSIVESQSLVQNKSDFIIKTEENQVKQKETQNTKYNKNNDSKFNFYLYFGDSFTNSMMKFIPFSHVNEKCKKDGQHFVTGFNNRTIWAIQMYDSSSKYPGGILTSEVVELGNFDQCMSVSFKPLEIQGAYAVVNVTFHRDNSDETQPSGFVEAHRKRARRNSLADGPEAMLWAVCVPDSCTEDDVKISIEHVLIPTFRSSNISVNIDVPSVLYTSRNTTMEYSNGALLIYGIVIISMILTIVGTLYELLTDNLKLENNGCLKKCLKSYSIMNNMNDLMADSKNKDFSIINGFKLIGIIGVIIGHRVAIDLAVPAFNTEFLNDIYNDYWLGFLKTSVIVEIFFTISGFLTYIIIEGRLKRGKPLQFLYLLSYRFVRIFPAYVTVMLIFAFIVPYIGNGPLWKLIIYPEAEFCRKNWWTNVLFINNYVNTYEMCMFHSWYLACDMHFFFIGTILTYIVNKWKKIGFYIYSVLFILSIYFPAKYIFDNQQWGVLPYFRSNMKSIRNTEFFHSVYIKSHFRITTYLIGIAGAYVYLKLKTMKFQLSVSSRIIGCATCILINIILVTSITGYFYLPNVTYNPWDHILYFTFHRTIYALTITYFLVVGSLTNFGFISSIFESKFCTVAARLSYVGFLVHLFGQLHSVGQIRQPQYENFWMLFWKLNADFATTVVYAVPFNLIIEAPNRKIFNHIMCFVLNEYDHSTSSIDKSKIDLNDNAALSKFQENYKL